MSIFAKQLKLHPSFESGIFCEELNFFIFQSSRLIQKFGQNFFALAKWCCTQ